MMATDEVVLRRASINDLESLVAVENAGFLPEDRFDRQRIRYLLTRANSTTLVLESNSAIIGSAIILWRRNSYIGHLYSLVVHPDWQGKGYGKRLLLACEEDAAKHGCLRMELEVRPTNESAISLYEHCGYRGFETIPGFYLDGGSALRMFKEIERIGEGVRMTMPYYAQTMDFTCGPACLLMAMKYQNPRLIVSRALELMLWKEATLIFMTSGLGGCGPFGLAVAARRRGFRARVVLSDQRTPFLTSVRDVEKKEVIRLVHEELRREAHRIGVADQYYNFSFADIAKAIRDGEVPIVLISTYRLHRVKAPHWVVVTGFDDENIYFHDPYEGFYFDNKRQAQHLQIPISEFNRMRRYGKELQKSVVFVGRNSGH